MKLGWKKVLTLAGVGMACTTVPLMAQQYQATTPVPGQYQQQYSIAPVNTQQLPQWKHAVQPQAAVPVQNGVQQVTHHFAGQQELPAQQQFAQPQYNQFQQYAQQGLPQYPVQQVPQQKPEYNVPVQNAPVQNGFAAQQPVPVVPQQTVVQQPAQNPNWNNFPQQQVPAAQPQTGYVQRYAYVPQQAPAQPVAPQQQVVQQPAVSPVAAFESNLVAQEMSPASQNVQEIKPVSGDGACCESDSCCCIEPLCESLDDCCSTECCDTTVGCCEPCCGPTFYAGAAAVWLKPHFQDNTAIVLDPPPSDNIVIPFDYDFEVSPRVWLGYEHCDGHGFRFSYWQFDEAADQAWLEVQPTQLAVSQVYGANGILTRNAFAGPGEWISADHSVDLQTADFEFTSRHEYCTHNVLLSAGIRYAKMEQEFAATAWTGGLGVTLDEYVRNRHGFEGFGPTVAIDWSRPFGDHGLSFYTNARGSILFGDVYQDVYEIKNAGADVGNDNYDGDDSLAIGELGMGLQYSVLGWSDCEWIFRAGYEGQLWLDAGGPIRTQGDMALHGLSFGVGFTH